MKTLFLVLLLQLSITARAQVITTIAGKGTFGFSGEGGPATNAEFDFLAGVTTDKLGNIYLADRYNNVIQKIDVYGILTRYAGNGLNGASGDGGPATNAQLKWPKGITMDDAGNLYIADAVNYRVRKVDTAGIISTIAGVGTAYGPNVCHGCDALIMQLNAPVGIAVDAYGNVYFSAIVDDVVHKITPSGKIYPTAGKGAEGFSGDGGPATNAQLHSPTMISLDNKGNLLIADKGNARIRKVWLGTTYTPTVKPGSSLLYVYPNPTVGKNFTCNAITADTNESADLVITDVVGKVVTTLSCTTSIPVTISLPVPAGMYFIFATTQSGNRMSAKIIVD